MQPYKRVQRYLPDLINVVRNPKAKYYQQAFDYNFKIAKHLNDIFKDLLGPKRRSKLIIKGSDDYKLTSDALDVLEVFKENNPFCKVLYEEAENLRKTIGDGVTSYVVLTTNLIIGAKKLFDIGLKHVDILSGYSIALDKSLEILDKIAIRRDFISQDELKTLIRIHFPEEETFKQVVNILHEAIKVILNNAGRLDPDNIQVVGFEGGDISDSKLVIGTVLYDNFITHMNMPHSLENVKVALIKQPVMVNKIWPVSEIAGIKAEISISSAADFKRIKEFEKEFLENKIQNLVNYNVRLLLSESKDIDDYVLSLLEKHGIAVVRRITKEESRLVSLSTGAKLVPDISMISESDLGFAKSFMEIKQGMRKYGGKSHIIVEGDPQKAKSCCIILRAGSEPILNDIKSSVRRAIRTIAIALKSRLFVPGAGITELVLHKALSDYARTIGGKKALGVEEFSRALYNMSTALFYNLGMDPFAMASKIVSRIHEIVNDFSLNPFKYIPDVLEVKKQVIRKSWETAVMIIRIKDIIYKHRIRVKIGGKSIES
jgi:chaperonin GroEL (HSP60 family)